MNDEENAWVIAFMNPRCGECKKFAPHWDKLQAYEGMLARNIKFAYVDLTVKDDMEVIVPYMGGIVVGYTPTLVLYGQDKSQP